MTISGIEERGERDRKAAHPPLPGMAGPDKHERWRHASLAERGRALEALCADAMRLLEADPELRSRVLAMQSASPRSPFPGRLRRPMTG